MKKNTKEHKGAWELAATGECSRFLPKRLCFLRVFRAQQYNANVEEEKRTYKPVKQLPREALMEIFRAGTASQVAEALWSATYHDPDWRWVQTECLRFLTYTDLEVRRAAAICLGLIAVFHRKLDVGLVLAALQRAGEDPEMKAWVEDSIADIRHSMKVQ